MVLMVDRKLFSSRGSLAEVETGQGGRKIKLSARVTLMKFERKEALRVQAADGVFFQL